MARVLPSTYTAPDPSDYLARLPILASGLATLGEGINWLLATVGNQPLVCQNWGDDLNQIISSTPTRVCTWQIPKLTDQHTIAEVAIVAEHAGSGGAVQFDTVEAADSIEVVVDDTERVWTGNGLALDFDGNDHELLEMRIFGDDTDPVIVHSVTVQWQPLTSPLAITIDGVSPWDEDIFDPDLPLSSAKARRALAQLAAILARRRVYWNWSALENSSNTDANAAMDRYLHTVRVPNLLGTQQQGWNLVTRLNASGVVGEASQVRLQYGDRDNPRYATQGILAGAAAAWYTISGVRLPDDPEASIATRQSHLGIWPGNETSPGGVATPWPHTTANLHSLCIYGR